MHATTRIVSLVGATLLASGAHAAVNGVIWRGVNPNLPPSANDPAYASLARYTFDLILSGDSGTQIRGVNMGDADDPSSSHLGLWTNGSVYNHFFGSDVRSPSFEHVFPHIALDTFVALGSTVPGPAISFAAPADLNADGVNDRVLRAHWFSDAGAALDANGELRILRVTVGYDPSYNPFLWNTGYLGT
ncbi:MAG: hypothetical protein IBJ10_09600 [Phycisphaerales bacterium]|nr:hypothetical protein [Phycisphaerales bacterium]